MTTIYSINADGRERYDSVSSDQVAKKIKMLRNQGQLNVRVIPEPSQKPVPQLDDSSLLLDDGPLLLDDGPLLLEADDIEVAPGIFQSVEDYQANHDFDELRDNNNQN